MKIIHCGDLHLGSSLKSICDNKEERKKEIDNAFVKLIDYAIENGIYNVILSGDVFDSNMVISTDKNFFYSLIKQHPEITFYYLKGNHDNKTSIIEEYENLKTFNDQGWTYYNIDNITICGLEITNNNQEILYNDLILNPNRVNIVVLHGDINKDLDLRRLANRNIDYLALGHLHCYKQISLDDRGTAIYCGCLEGRNFNETGSKGFVLLDIDDQQIKPQFIKNSIREIYLKTITFNNMTSLHEAITYIQEQLSGINPNSIIRLSLNGKVTFNPEELDCIKNVFNFYYLEIINEVTKSIDITKYAHDLSLKGEFVRLVLNDVSLDDSQKEKILMYGLKFLDNEKDINI